MTPQGSSPAPGNEANKAISGRRTRSTDRPFLIEGSNQGALQPPRQPALHELFQEVAHARPLEAALTFRGQDLSYGELNRRANRLAHRLVNLGVGPESLVGVAMERSFEFIVGLLAIVKAGGAYVPLDLTYPAERLNFMLRDSHPEIVLTGSKGLQASAPWIRELKLSADGSGYAEESDQDPDVSVTLRHAAYVMYTSGSTGSPKGVVIEQQSIVRLVREPNYMTISAHDTFLQLAPTSFDASTLEIWGSLLNGARLVIMTPGSPSLKEIGKIIEAEKVTTLWMTAGLFHAMVDEQLPSLATVRNMLAGGDVLSPSHVERFLNAHRSSALINGYGPTEGTTFTCCQTVRHGDPIGKTIPIGRPISRTRVLILDESMNQVSIGEPGELYIGGDGLARGYLNQPELTASRFIRNPYSTDLGDVLYRSGDIVAVRADGAIDFLGRKDSQVKIRGFRVELGEIEVALQQYPAVRHAVAIVVSDAGREKTIHAFWTAKAGSQADSKEILLFAEKHLPAYMMPGALTRLEALPLTENGKVDRKKLLEVATLDASRKESYAPPSDELEVELLEIWEEILDVKHIGIQDDFFRLGGHSLLAARMFARIEERLHKSLPLATMFHATTIEKLAAMIRAEGWTPHWSVLVPIQPSGSRPPLFLVHGLFGNVLIFFGLRHHTPPDQPVYGVQAEGMDSGRATVISIPEMAQKYIEEIRQIQPKGPYYIGGFSAGGLVAFEMAQQLTAAGEQVALLALLDSFVEVAGGYWLKSFYSRRALRMSMLSLRASWIGTREIGVMTMAGKKVRNMVVNLRIMAWMALGRLPGRSKKGAREVAGFLNPREAFTRAVRVYTPRPYAGSAVLFRNPDSDFKDADDSDGWGRYIQGRLDIQEISGGHENMFREPHIASLANQLVLAMEAARGSLEQTLRVSRVEETQ